MLFLTRRIGETIRIGDDITVEVVGIQNGYVRIGIDAPRALLVLREELVGKRVPPAPPSAAGLSPI